MSFYNEMGGKNSLKRLERSKIKILKNWGEQMQNCNKTKVFPKFIHKFLKKFQKTTVKTIKQKIKKIFKLTKVAYCKL